MKTIGLFLAIFLLFSAVATSANAEDGSILKISGAKKMPPSSNLSAIIVFEDSERMGIILRIIYESDVTEVLKYFKVKNLEDLRGKIVFEDEDAPYVIKKMMEELKEIKNKLKESQEEIQKRKQKSPSGMNSAKSNGIPLDFLL
ncbi:MAG: hypothetical protein V1804_00015 [Patescibacteria group bacterium]